VQSELLADVSTVIAHGEDTEIQHLGDLLTGLAMADVFQYFFFAASQHSVWAHQSTGTRHFQQYERGAGDPSALGLQDQAESSIVEIFLLLKN